MKKIEYIMTKKVASCYEDNNLAEVGAVMWENNCGALPVLNRGDRVVGLITDRDICIALTTRNLLASEVKVDEVISKKLYACSLDDGVEKAIEVMLSAKVRRLPVLDRDSHLRGMITLSDILIRMEDGFSGNLILKTICDDIKPLASKAAS